MSATLDSQIHYDYDVFVSYNRNQAIWARGLVGDLIGEGFKVWFDKYSIIVGNEWQNEIDQSIPKSKNIIFILSPEFLKSKWTRYEMDMAIREKESGREIGIFPLKYSECEIPSELSRWHFLDFSNTHSDPLFYKFCLTQLITSLDSSRKQPVTYEKFKEHKDLSKSELSPIGELPGSVVPFLNNPNFVGRETELKIIYEKLNPDSNLKTSDALALTGPGGIGKTQIAVEYAYRYGRYYKGGVFWLDMSNPDNIANQVSEFAIKNIENQSKQEQSLYKDISQDDLISKVKSIWDESPNPRLLIFDNVDQLSVINSWRPKPNNTKVLITTRIDSQNHKWVDMGISTIPMNILPREQSIKLLIRGREKRSSDSSERKNEDAICDLLGDHPLAIHLAGTYLSAYKNEISLDEYLDELKNESIFANETLTNNEIEFDSPTKHIQNILATFETSYNKLNQENQTDVLADKLFHLAYYFAPITISRELFVRALKMDNDNSKDRIKVANSLRRLCELGLLQTSENGRIIIHRLLREFARYKKTAEQNDEEIKQNVFEAIGNFAEGMNKSDNPSELKDQAEHIRYALQDLEEKLLKDDPEKKWSNLTSWLHNELGYHLRMFGDLKGAKEHYFRALELNRNRDDQILVLRYSNLAAVLSLLGELEDAKKNFQFAIETAKKYYEENSPQMAILNSNLGSVMFDLGDMDEAERLFTNALNIEKSMNGEICEGVARELSKLGMIQKAHGNLKNAKDYLEKAIDIHESVFAQNSKKDDIKAQIKVATPLHNLGLVMMEMKDFNSAKACFIRSLKIKFAYYGEELPNIANTKHYLGLTLKALGDIDGAKENLESSLKILEKYFGTEHEKVKNARMDLENLTNF